MKTSPAIEKLIKKFSPKQLMFVWYRHYKMMFFVGFLLVFGFGSYQWYTYLYRYQWSDQEKKQFLDSNFKETAFKENKFKELIQRLDERAHSHEDDPKLSRDIFSGKGL